MKKYKVVLHPDAAADIDSAFQWGCRTWGEENARVWIRELRKLIRTRLTTMPLSCPRAPESDELGVIIRQLIVGRYRILFIVETRTVEILHVIGSYLGEPLSE
ncbi:MAG TPA: type II toxin-antitoxin system RelE/ParE family toxin [Pyrinomonadaceae bacterium]|jgi:plasmid stabilization system protein ParE|nr:type II toxin-antitoxin system RelE/ParE family toxin [Pyrinomonadaceae bacterium]